jgi:ADP-ribosylglycohydrolase
LYKEKSYQEAMTDILLKGGDTDTNAAIVGGLLGARDGLTKLDRA